MMTRKEFFNQILIKVGQAVNRIGPGQTAAPSANGRFQSIDLAFTELCPSLLALSADGLAEPTGKPGCQDLRRMIYQQMTDRIRHRDTDGNPIP